MGAIEGGVLIPEDDNGHPKGPGRWCGVYTPDDEPRALYEGHDPETAVELTEWYLHRYGRFPRLEVGW